MSKLTRRSVGWIAVGLVAIGLPMLLWYMSRTTVTPEQRIADAEPPPLPVVDVQIERRTLEDALVFRGVVEPVRILEIGAPEMSDRSAIVVDIPAQQSDTVGDGDVIAVVSDRPIIAVTLPVPLYRSLVPMLEGPDVRRLQAGLRRLGYSAPVSGVFDEETQAAVASLYDDRGFVPVPTPEEYAAAAVAADSAVTQAKAAYSAARSEGGSVSVARDALRAAEAEAEAAKERVGITVPLGEVVGFSSFPLVVASVDSVPGAEAGDSLVTLSDGDVQFVAKVDVLTATLLPPGTVVAVGPEGWAFEVTTNTSRDDVGQPVVYFRTDNPIDPSAIGGEFRAEATLRSSSGAVLAVPVSAIRSGPDGDYIRVVDDGDVRRVIVVTGESIGGWVEIEGVSATLSEGMTVRLT